ncbi:PIN domain-containing protein [Brotaphodocola sp.]|uniref:PIN domain-containing protein n=1 Tax=Brotaphodocola sp. TaxID=3073577 RepID=UPI003D7DF781
MKRTYLIDSENINDVWVEILDALGIGDCIMVFFTDKSAHMGYDRIVRLMELEKGTVKWIRCFGGQNALDFQLVTELGHQICQDQEREYVIVSNDTGYDAAVRYWQQRGCSVSRIKGIECTKLAARAKKQRQEEARQEQFKDQCDEQCQNEQYPKELDREKSCQIDQEDSCLRSAADTDSVDADAAAAVADTSKQESDQSSDDFVHTEQEEQAEQMKARKPAQKKRKKTKSSAVLAKTLFDKVATPERKAQMESLTDTAKTALGAVLETATEMIAEQIAEKKAEPKRQENQTRETRTPDPQTPETQEEEYPELEDERDLNYDPENPDEEDDSETAKSPKAEDRDVEDTDSEKKTSEEKTPEKKTSEKRSSESGHENSGNGEIEAEKKSETIKEQLSAAKLSEEEEAERMIAYTPCQRSILRIFRASGSADPHQDLEFFMELCSTVKLSDMSMVHNVLEYQFGQAVGNSLYRYLKENPKCREELSAGYNSRKKQRERAYLDLILKRNQIEFQEDMTETVWKILTALPRKNLSGIHTALVKKFGQEAGSSCYAVLRNHVKIIRDL